MAITDCVDVALVTLIDLQIVFMCVGVAKEVMFGIVAFG